MQRSSQEEKELGTTSLHVYKTANLAMLALAKREGLSEGSHYVQILYLLSDIFYIYSSLFAFDQWELYTSNR